MVASFICGNFRKQGRQIEAGVEMLDGRAAGEGEPIGAVLAQPGRSAGGVLGFGHGLIAGDVIDDGAEGLERLGQFPVGHLGAEEANLEVFNALKPGEGLGDAGGHGLLGHQVHLEVEFFQFAGRGGADGGDAGAAMSRISWNCLKKYSKNLATPLGLVKTSQS